MNAKQSALIIASSHYEDATLRKLVAPPQDAEALARVLQDPAVGGFKVTTLLDQPSYRVKREIQAFFADRQRDDLLLLYFSGHGIKDEEGSLYFATADTQQKFLQATAVEASFVNDMMRRSLSRRQVLLLDCCHSGAFAHGMVAKAGATVDTRGQFEGRGRVVLTASDAMQYSFEGDEVKGEGVRSVFTRILVQGLESGDADVDGDGLVSLDELYDYVHRRVTDEAPHQSPRKWALDVEGEIFIAKNPSPARRVELPAKLLEVIENPLVAVRLGAVQELDRLLRGRNKGLALAAQAALMSLREDDSRQVSNAAEKCLAAYAETQRLKEQEAARARAEAQRLAEEKAAEPEKAAQQERLARQQAEADRLAREKAEREQLAREQAERERLERERAEAECLAAQRAEAERARREKEQQEGLAREKAELERRERERAETERLAGEKAEAEREATERTERERLERDKAEAERVRREKEEQERRAREEAHLAGGRYLPKSKIRRLFLLYKPPRKRAWLPRFYFYASVAMAFSAPFQTKDQIVALLLGSIIIAIPFRFLSVWLERPRPWLDGAMGLLISLHPFAILFRIFTPGIRRLTKRFRGGS